MALGALLPALLAAAPAWARHAEPHSGHQAPQAKATPAPAPKPMDHADHAMPGMAMKPAAAPRDTPHPPHHDHAMPMPMPAPAHEAAPDSAMPDHAAMGHAAMGHDSMDAPAAQPSIAPPPPEAGSGPARAADAVWGADAMAASRAALRAENGGQRFTRLLIDRLEYRAGDGADGYAWEAQGWYGGDLDRFSLKSEGEGPFGGAAERAELQALWSHAIGTWFDLNAGLRHDFAGPDRTQLVLGVQGLAPYRFELDGNLFLSDHGDLTARAEAELDQRITQRLILQPRAEVNLAAQDIPELGVGAGLDRAEIGLRLRYEFAREFAPYIGVAREWRVGGSADYARLRGDDTQATRFVAGLRVWF